MLPKGQVVMSCFEVERFPKPLLVFINTSGGFAYLLIDKVAKPREGGLSAVAEIKENKFHAW